MFVPYCMQDATPSTTESQQPLPTVELLLKENEQLKTKLTWFETEYEKLAKLIAAQFKRSEKHLSPGGSPWLPFDSQVELEQAKQEAEAEAQKVLDELAAKTPPKAKKPRRESLPEYLPVIKKLCDVAEKDRVCPEHGLMAIIGTDSTKTLVHVPAKLFVIETEYPKYACSCCKEHGVITAERPKAVSWARCGLIEVLTSHPTTFSTFAYRGIGMAPMNSFAIAIAWCKVTASRAIHRW